MSMKNRPQASDYIKSAKGVSFSYAIGCNSFQKGTLGDADSYVTGTLHFNYGKPQQIKNVTLNFKGIEKTVWHKSQARSKAVYSGEHIIVDLIEEVWKSDNPDGGFMNLDIPFKIKLPPNLPDTIETEIGNIEYIIRAVITRKGSLGLSASNQVVEIKCSLKRTLHLTGSDNVPYKLRGESRCGIDYLFSLPPKNNFNPGAYVSIPMRIRFLKPGISVERIEIALKTCMDFRCSIPSETRHAKEVATSLLVPRQELKYTQPTTGDHFDGECSHTINLFVPRNVQPTYSGRYISINHQLIIKFCLWGADSDFQVEESIRVTNVFDHQQQPSSGQSSSHSNISPTFQRSKSPDELKDNTTNDTYISNDYDHGIGTAVYLNPIDQSEKISNYSGHSSRPSQNSLNIITDPDYQQLPPSYPDSKSEELIRPKIPYNNSINNELVHHKALYNSSSDDLALLSKKTYNSPTNHIINNYTSNDDLFYSYGFDDEDDMLNNSALCNTDLLLQQNMQRLAIAHQQKQHHILYNQQNPIYAAPNSPPIRLAPLPALPINMKKQGKPGVILSPTPRIPTGNAIMNLNASVNNNKYPPPYGPPPSERGQPVVYPQMPPQPPPMHLMIDSKQSSSRKQHYPSPTRPQVTVAPPYYQNSQRQIIDESS
ncbi:41734_t:CDS:1 [Gigaspora margarita]|uniref:41734_t:CDS:1 n=1 Tax=Gigaspora margarita TaxID=4874 RepID=A0ABN7UMB3_GIGMA|nr:41734_t:CDS:1 [Gigaspora margarita]